MEIDPATKRELYVALARHDLTLKDWFLRRAEEYVRDQQQVALPFAAERENPYGGKGK